MNRGDLVRRMVLRAIADDYENVDQVILRVFSAANEPIEFQGMPPLDVIETYFQTYFYD